MNARAWYATNARDLLATREQGLAPDGRVVVSLVGGQFADVAAVTLHARADAPVDRMDWRMLVNLEVWLWAGPSAALEWLLQTTSRIAHARPHKLVLRFESKGALHDVDVGTGLHTPAMRELPPLHTFLWLPTDLSDTPISAKLRRALLAKHERWTEL